jgi:hypothetical protein
MTIELTPEMSEIVERLRGNMSPQRFLALLLQIADSRAVSATPSAVLHDGASLTPVLTPEDGDGYTTKEESAQALRSRLDSPRPASAKE